MVDKFDGTANMRADGGVKSGSVNGSPAGGGTAAGGTENFGATVATKEGGAKATPSGGGTHWPEGVDTFGGASV
jgi:hypothetical protein